ncbi:MAG: ABC transporter permease subunit [Deltaproteobacteria bacterium]|nr:ABC transporter permease subunit [Deltaproteobacteria bacterium]
MIFALGLLVSSTASARLRWGADAEGGAPYVLRDPKAPDKVIGFEVDLAEALSREVGEPIDFVQYEFGSLLPGLERGDLDLAMNGLEITPDRVQRVRFSRPYYVYRLQLVVRADDARFAGFDACAAAKCVVGTLGDTAAERLLDARGVAKRVYDGQAEPYRDLGLSRLDAVLLDVPVATYWARPDPKLRFVGEPFARGLYAIAFRKDREALAVRFDGAIERLAARGELERIYKKWSLWYDEQRSLGALGAADESARTWGEESARAWTPARYLPLLLQGALTTILIAVVSMVLAVLLGLPIAVARMWGPWPVRWLATAYVELFRGVPVLLLIFFLYYGLPTLGVKLSAISAAILGFGLNYAAYEAEIYRAGIASIPVGQWEAAASLGMGRRLTFRRVILPQAFRVVLPPMTNDFVALFKDTSLVSVIAVVELTKQYQILAKSSMKYLEMGAVTAALYLLIAVPLGAWSRRLEARASKGAG